MNQNDDKVNSRSVPSVRDNEEEIELDLGGGNADYDNHVLEDNIVIEEEEQSNSSKEERQSSLEQHFEFFSMSIDRMPHQQIKQWQH